VEEAGYGYYQVFAAANPVVGAEPEVCKGKYMMPVRKIAARSELAQDVGETIVETQGDA
jgi:hypothetical protein